MGRTGTPGTNRLVAVLALLAAAVLVLAGCGDDRAETVAGATGTSEAPALAGEPSQTQSSAPSAAAPAGAPVPGAYAGAGGPRPADAEPLPTYVAGGVTSATFLTPSGGIGCDFAASADQGGCGVRAYNQSKPYGCTQLAGTCKANWFFPFAGDRVGPIKARTDTTGWMNQPAASVSRVAYGKVVYFQDWVCASAYTGLTCWNTKTGSGVFLSNERSETFTGPGGAAAPASTRTVAPAQTGAPSSGAIVLGATVSGGAGYGTARPTALDNGGSRTGMVDQISWSSWGGDRAEGRGRGFNAQGDVMGGAPETYSVIVVAFDPGTCGGQRAYRKLFVGSVGQAFDPANARDVCTA